MAYCQIPVRQCWIKRFTSSSTIVTAEAEGHKTKASKGIGQAFQTVISERTKPETRKLPVNRAGKLLDSLKTFATPKG